MISLDFSVVYQIILFMVLWVILDRVLFRPYLGLLEDREKRTSGARHDAADLEHEGARLRAQYEEKILDAQARGRAMKEAILHEARQRREQIINNAREEAAGSLERVREDVQNQMDNERHIAAVEAESLARDMASKVLGRNIA